MKRKLLLVSPYFPYPARDGGKVRIYNLLKHLARDNDLSLLSYIESEEMRRFVPPLEEIGVKVFTVVRDESRRIVRDDIPRSMSFFYTPEMIRELERVLAGVRPHLVQIDFLVMTPYVTHIKGIPVIYTEHDMSNIDFTQSFHDRDLPEKERFVEWSRLLEYTRKILPVFDRIIVLTERDEKILHSFLPQARSLLVPTGVDVDYYLPVSPEDSSLSNNLLYVGHYKHYPNYDAVFYFIDDIFPAIRREVPDARFLVVGSGVHRELAGLDREGVSVIGEVEDVRPSFRQAGVFVAPIRLGGGIKGKILEAMASGIPVVATEEASKGIRCTGGKDIVVAEGEADFAVKTVRLLKEREQRAMLATNGRRLAEEQYDWKKITARLNAFYQTFC